MSLADDLREKARDYDAGAIAAADQHDAKTAEIKAILALTFYELAETLEHQEAA